MRKPVRNTLDSVGAQYIEPLRQLKMILFILLLPALLLGALDSSAITAYEQKIETHASRADSLKAQIEESRKTLEDLKAKENQSLSQLNNMEETIELTGSLLEELTEREDSLSRDMERARVAVDSIGIELSKRQDILEERLRQIYKTGDITIISVILGSATPTEMIRKIRYAQDLNRYDREILMGIADDRLRRNTEIAILSIQRDYFTTLKAEKAAESEALKKQIGERKSLLSSIRSEKEKWQASLVELEKSEKEIQRQILSFIQERDRVSEALANSFKELKGKLRWPVEGEILSSYGKQKHPIHGTVVTNKGIAIAGNSGTPVKVVADGVVEYVDRLPGYGRVIIVNHYGGFMTIYAHLGAFKVAKGAKVSSGAVIGDVGESGSLEGPRLHFEIREGADTRDPESWLGRRSL